MGQALMETLGVFVLGAVAGAAGGKWLTL